MIPEWYNWRYLLVYAVAFALAVGFELHAAFVRRKRGDTITELTKPWVRRNRVTWWGSLLLFATFVSWLFYHFWIDG